MLLDFSEVLSKTEAKKFNLSSIFPKMDRLLRISEAAEQLGVSESTLRRWEKEKRLLPDERTEGQSAQVQKSHS
jgi:excisionase family DNA binding protein